MSYWQPHSPSHLFNATGTIVKPMAKSKGFIHFLTLFLCLFSSIFAEKKSLLKSVEEPSITDATVTLESWPSAVVAGCVNAITGDYFESETDVVAPGCHPLVVQRSYCSGEGIWHFQHLSTLHVGKSGGGHHVDAVYKDDGGARLPYRAYLRHGEPMNCLRVTDKALKKLTNGIEGKGSWSQSKIEFVRPNGEKCYKVTLGSGIERLFECYKRKSKHHQEGVKEGRFHLTWQKNPNGDQRFYTYNEEDELVHVTAISETGQLLNEINRDYDETRELWKHCATEVEYQFRSGWLLFAKPSNNIPTHYRYYGKWLEEKRRPNNRFLRIDYEVYDEDLFSFKQRVFRLSAPVGRDDKPYPLYTFYYQKGMTTVLDSARHSTRYEFDEDTKLLLSISKFVDKKAYATDRFFWSRNQGENCLKTRSFESEGFCHLAHTLNYDHFGNVTEKTIWGNLTGRFTAPIILNQGTPQTGEAYQRKTIYSPDKFHLLLREENGRCWVQSTYYPNSNRLATRVTGSGPSILKRERFFYDANNLLLHEVWNDGDSPNQDDMSHVTEWHHRHILSRTGSPFGLPELVQETYSDNRSPETLLKKYLNLYSSMGQIVEQRHYDSQNQWVYSLCWQYDSYGNPIKETNAIGETILREYDANGNKIFEQGPRHDCHKKFVYDYSNRLISEEEHWHSGETFITSYRYNLRSQKIATVDPYGHETKFTYDDLGRLIQTEYPAYYQEGQLIKPTQRIEYSPLGYPIAIWDCSGHCTKKEYTVRGQPYFIQYPDGSIERKEYTLDGLLEKEIARNGLVTRYTHDHFGRVIQTEKTDPQGNLLSKSSATYSTFQLLSETDPAGNTTHYTYDGAGRRTSIRKGDQLTTYTYDSLGRICKESNGDTHILRRYDLLNRVIEEEIQNSQGETLKKEGYSYDPHGNRTQLIAYTDQGIAITTKEYNPHNEPTLIKDPDGNCTHYTYTTSSINGQLLRKITKTDPLGTQEVTIYDPLNRISQELILNPFGMIVQSSRHTYDSSNNRLSTQTDRFINQQLIDTITIQWEYDSLGNMIHSIEPQQKQTYFYYKNGQKEKTTKPDGTTLTYQYDLLGRLQSLSSSDNTIHYLYIYDSNNNPTLITDLIHNTQTLRSYDCHNNILSETLDTGYTFQYSYNSSNQLTSITLPDQSTIHYQYNGHQLKTVERIKPNITYSHHYLKYDLSDNPLQIKLPGEAGEITYAYDLLQRNFAIHAPHWQEWSHTYDLAGNLLAREFIDYFGIYTTTFTYDSLYQLTSEEGITTHQYENDSLYNRISKDNNPHTLNSLNQLLHQTDTHYRYDPNGNLITIQNDQEIQLTYDALDRLISIGETTYHYDPFHRRTIKTHQNQITHYLYQEENEIGAYINGELQELRILGLGKAAEISAAIALELQQEIYIPIHDTLGNIVTLLDLQGGFLQSYYYTAFGEENTFEEESSQQFLSPWRFSSKRTDPETNFIYFGRRYYIPSLGRWLTPDPLGFTDGLNLYTYVHNHPLAYFDPDGQFAFFLAPLALSLAANYCIPIVATYATETLGLAVVGSCLSAFLHGNNLDFGSFATGIAADPLSAPAQAACAGLGLLIGSGKGLTIKGSQLALNTATSIASREMTNVATAVATKVQNGLNRNWSLVAHSTASQTAQKTVQVAERYVAKTELKASQWRFPNNPKDWFKELPRDSKGRIYFNETLRIRPEKHALRPGELFNPRHHGLHYHIETKVDPLKPWSQSNIYKLKPDSYQKGKGTGFLPGEFFPGSGAF